MTAPDDPPQLGALGDRLRVPPTATDEEAAAIVAAVAAYLGDRAEESREAGADADADTRRWALAGRLAATGATRGRLPRRAPADPWRAAGRADRF